MKNVRFWNPTTKIACITWIFHIFLYFLFCCCQYHKRHQKSGYEHELEKKSCTADLYHDARNKDEDDSDGDDHGHGHGEVDGVLVSEYTVWNHRSELWAFVDLLFVNPNIYKCLYLLLSLKKYYIYNFDHNMNTY